MKNATEHGLTQILPFFHFSLDRKWFLICMLWLFSVQLGNSQVLLGLLFGDKLNSEKLEFGLSIGGNWSTLSNADVRRWGRDLALGLYFDIKLSENFFLHAAAIPKFTNGADRIPVYSLNDPVIDSIYATGSVARILPYIPVPIMLRYKTNFHLGAEFGPVTSIRFRRSMKDEFRTEVNGDEITLQRGIGDLTSPFDFALGFGLYYKFGDGRGVEMNIRYMHGLVNVFKRAEGPDALIYPPQRNRSIQLLFHIPIGRKKALKAQQEKEEGASPDPSSTKGSNSTK